MLAWVVLAYLLVGAVCGVQGWLCNTIAGRPRGLALVLDVFAWPLFLILGFIEGWQGRNPW